MNITNEQPEPKEGSEVEYPGLGGYSSGIVLKNSVVLWDNGSYEDWRERWNTFFNEGGRIINT